MNAVSHPPRLKRRHFIAAAGGASAALASPNVLHAQSVELTFSSWLPAASIITENLFVIWASEIEALTEGRVRITFLPKPLGPPPAHNEILSSGAADLAYSVHGYTGAEFPRAKIGQFSFLGDAYSASHAFSKVYGRLLRAEEEHPNFELLGLFQHGPGVLMLKNRKITTPDDYKGLRIRTSGGYIGDLMSDLGAVNVPMSPFKVGPALAAGEIDGVAFPYEAGPAFGITEQITDISELPNGYYNATWFMGMSRDAAQKVSAADLDLIRAHSARTIHVLAAKAFDYADYLGKETFSAQGTVIAETPREVTGHVRKIADTYEAEWASELASAGYDGAKALAFTRRITNGN